MGTPASSDVSTIAARFRELTSFTTGRTESGATKTPDYAAYVDILTRLRQATFDRYADNPHNELGALRADFDAARGEVKALLSPSYDSLAVGILEAWLLAPLTIPAPAGARSPPGPTTPPAWAPRKPT